MGLDRNQQPIIIGITGHVGTEFTNKGIDAGMDDVLSKPCYLENLLKIMDKYDLLENLIVTTNKV